MTQVGAGGGSDVVLWKAGVSHVRRTGLHPGTRQRESTRRMCLACAAGLRCCMPSRVHCMGPTPRALASQSCMSPTRLPRAPCCPLRVNGIVQLHEQRSSALVEPLTCLFSRWRAIGSTVHARLRQPGARQGSRCLGSELCGFKACSWPPPAARSECSCQRELCPGTHGRCCTGTGAATGAATPNTWCICSAQFKYTGVDEWKI